VKKHLRQMVVEGAFIRQENTNMPFLKRDNRRFELWDGCLTLIAPRVFVFLYDL